MSSYSSLFRFMRLVKKGREKSIQHVVRHPSNSPEENEMNESVNKNQIYIQHITEKALNAMQNADKCNIQTALQHD